MPTLQKTCEQLKKEYDHLQSEKNKLSLLLEEGIRARDLMPVRQLKKEIIERLKNTKESIITPGKVFLAELRKEDNTAKLIEVVKTIIENGHIAIIEGSIISEENYKKVAQVFSSIESDLCLTDRNYKQFVDVLSKWFNDIKKAFNEEIDPNNNLYVSYCDDIVRLIHSVFLNKFLKPDTELHIREELPIEIRDCFGCFLKQGKIHISRIGRLGGYGMEGGVLYVDKAGDFLGCCMKGGIIHVTEAQNHIGPLMGGGIINMREGGNSSVGFMDGGIVILGNVKENLAGNMKGGTILMDSLKSFISLSGGVVKSSVYHYNQETQSYSSLKEKRSLLGVKQYQPAQVIKTQKDLQRFFQQRHGLSVIKKLDNILNPTQDLDHVILVLYQTPKDNIGEGMKGGVLILEDQKVSKEEVKKRISSKKRGGMILMRVPSAHDPKETTLEIIG